MSSTMPRPKKETGKTETAKPPVKAPARRTGATIHDVARHVGVSSMTVSRVVNGIGGVKPELRERVLAAIKELGHVPNVAARAARAGVTRIGVLFSNPRSSNLGEFLMGAFTAGGKLGCQIVVEPTAAHAVAIDAVRAVIAAGVDAVILPPPLCDSMQALELLWRAQIQAISFATGDPRSHSSAVFIDDFEGARSMTRHLIDLGHRDIAFVLGNPAHSPSRRREEGFRATMAEAGLLVPPNRLVQGMFTYLSGMEVAKTLLACEPAARPTAIFASNDDMAAGVVAVALGLGIKMPTELSVAGFDDTPIAESIWPALTTIHQPIAEMAASAVTLAHDMVKRARSGGSLEISHHRCNFSLVVRDSTGLVATKLAATKLRRGSSSARR
jgi:LacI family transcriptional regulator